MSNGDDIPDFPKGGSLGMVEDQDLLRAEVANIMSSIRGARRALGRNDGVARDVRNSLNDALGKAAQLAHDFKVVRGRVAEMEKLTVSLQRFVGVRKLETQLKKMKNKKTKRKKTRRHK